MKAALIIPARHGSTRLAAKPLCDLLGLPLIVRVLQRAQATSLFSHIIVATDDVQIAEVVRAHGGEAWMTRAGHPSGSDRVTEVAEQLECDVIVNLQGDEPLIEPADLERLATALLTAPSAEMATLRFPITTAREFFDPNVVKVVCDEAGFALYFSRAPIPFHRDGGVEGAFKHIGVYAYTRDFLFALSSRAQTPLEKHEGLEQLRALTMGARIKVIGASRPTLSIDTPEDLEEVRALLAQTLGTGSQTLHTLHPRKNEL